MRRKALDEREKNLRTMYVEFFHTTQDILRLIEIYIRKRLKPMALCQLSLAKHAFCEASKLSSHLNKYRNKAEKKRAREDLAGLKGYLQGAEEVIVEMAKK